jgi:predicted kinase
VSTSGDTPVLIVTGPAGVGKSTAAEILTERSARGVHLESDLFFRFIRSGYVEPWKPESHEQNRTVMRIVAQTAVGYAAAGYSTIVDGIVIPGWFLEPLRDALHGAGHPVAYAVLRAPLSVCKARAQARGREPLGDPEVIERLWRDFADLGDLEPHAVEVGERSPEESADLLERLLEEGALTVDAASLPWSSRSRS